MQRTPTNSSVEDNRKWVKDMNWQFTKEIQVMNELKMLRVQWQSVKCKVTQ